MPTPDDSAVPITVQKGEVREGVKKLTWWALGALVSLLVGIGSAAYTDHERIHDLDIKLDEQADTIQKLDVRIARQEAQAESYHELDTKLAVLNEHSADRDRQVDRIIAMLEARP